MAVAVTTFVKIAVKIVVGCYGGGDGGCRGVVYGAGVGGGGIVGVSDGCGSGGGRVLVVA